MHPANISLKTPLVKFRKGETSAISLNVPFVSAIMQSVSDHKLGIALARNGGLSFIFGSQSIESQAEMVYKVKSFKAGFVVSNANLTRTYFTRCNSTERTLRTRYNWYYARWYIRRKITGNSNRTRLPCYPRQPGSENQRIYDLLEKLITGKLGIGISEANDIIWDNKLNCLPIIDDNQHLKYFVFRKDYENHKANPNELSDENMSLLVGAGINSRDYKERVPALLEAGVDVMCIDSSDGFSEYQKETLEYIKANFGEHVRVGAGNVVDRDGFMYLAEAGADFVKVGRWWFHMYYPRTKGYWPRTSHINNRSGGSTR